MHDEQFVQTLFPYGPSGDAMAVIMRLRAAILSGIIHRVDRSRLGAIRRAGEREISVTTRFAKYGQFVAYTTVSAFRMAVIQRPVAMDESVPRIACGIPGDEPQ